MLREVRNECGWIPTCSHSIQIFCEVGRVNGSILSVKASKKSKWFPLTKIGDAILESTHVFL